MSIPILVVDKDPAVHRRENAGWARRGIGAVRVECMAEAIEAARDASLLFVAINADNITYLPMLPALRKTTAASIFIITSSFSHDSELVALHNGADVFAPFKANTEVNIEFALAYLRRHSEQLKRHHERLDSLVYGKLFILPGLHQVFCNDMEVPLTKKEREILLYLIANRGIVLTYQQIFSHAWGRDYHDENHGTLWTHIRRMRNKIMAATGTSGYIINVRNVGYKLPVVAPEE